VPARHTVLIDLDGTLSHSEPGILGSLTAAMEANGVDVPPIEVLRTVIGPPFSSGLPEIGVPADKLDAVVAHYRVVYGGGRLFETTLYDGVTAMLDGLREAGLLLAVATSKPQDAAVRILDHLGIADRFVAVAGADLATGTTDKASVIARALGLLGIQAGPGVVMVGDRRHDIEGARHHGLDAIAVAWGYGDAAEHSIAGAWATAATPADVVRMVTAA
jgi:phosphoglycolate phosphatase